MCLQAEMMLRKLHEKSASYLSVQRDQQEPWRRKPWAPSSCRCREPHPCCSPVGFNLCFQATSLILVEPAEEKGSSTSCPGMEPLEETGFPFGSPQTSHGAPRWDQPGEQAAFCVGLAQGALVRGLAKHDGVIYCHPPCPK